MKKLLIVSYDFPPSSIGIWRTIKFCRYMGAFGWRPYILTVKPVRSPRHDEAPLAELPPGTEIRRTESLDQNRVAWLASRAMARFRKGGSSAGGTGAAMPATHAGFRRVMDVLRAWLLIPDDRCGWRPFAVRAGRRWMREERFDAVYTTSFPSTAHVVGERLAREFRVPLIADFRDIWIGSYYFYKPATALHDRIQRRMERRVVARAAAVISATGPITDDFLERYPDQPGEKFHTITNGFDPGDFDFSAAQPDSSVYTITYAGTLYGSTSPAVFFRAVRMLLRAEPRWKRVLRLRFIGAMIEPYRAMIQRYGLGEITRVDNYLAHGEALRAMAEADALLLLVADTPGSHIMLTQKVFEYAAARRPIIGLVPDGAARDFLLDIDEGPILDAGDVRGTARALRRMLRAWQKNGRQQLPENPRLAAYERRRLTEDLCRVLDDATSRRRKRHR